MMESRRDGAADDRMDRDSNVGSRDRTRTVLATMRRLSSLTQKVILDILVTHVVAIRVQNSK